MKVRHATVDDCGAISQLENSFPEDQQFPYDCLVSLVEDTDNIVYVMEDANHDVIGYILGWIEKDEVYISSIAIDPLHRGKKYAQWLVQIFRDKYSVVCTDIRKENVKAQQMFDILGFHQESSSEASERWVYRCQD
jgi:ribosomal protein S18 acetylase RimI-like enzyme